MEAVWPQCLGPELYSGAGKGELGGGWQGLEEEEGFRTLGTPSDGPLPLPRGSGTGVGRVLAGPTGSVCPQIPEVGGFLG